MYSIKPGRGPSLVGAFGAILMAVVGIGWIFFALSMGAPPFFALFGVAFVVIAIGMAVYNFYNASARNRMSMLDVTTGSEEPDPLAKALGYTDQPQSKEPDQPAAGPRKYPGGHCPFCGTQVDDKFDYCPKCGKDI